MEGEPISDKKIRRVLHISRINAWSILGFAGLSALVVLLLGDFFGFLVGVAVALGGWMELRGNQLLAKRIPCAFHWLVASQSYLLLVLWAYCYLSIVRFDPANPWARISPGLKDLILSINPDSHLVESMLKFTYYGTYAAVILTVLIYQGGLCLFYFSQKKYLVAAPE